MAGAMKVILASLLSLSALAANAQQGDPTRPPQAFIMDAAQSPDGVVLVDEFRLQSVMLPQHGRPIAIIGGRTVPLGGKVGEATLTRLTEKEAVLQGPDGITRLYLTPEVNKQLIVTPKARKTGKSGRVKDLP